MRKIETTQEADLAMNVLLKALNVDYSDLEPETILNLNRAINRDTKVKDSALLYLTCNSTRAEAMRDRLERDVLALYERGY